MSLLEQQHLPEDGKVRSDVPGEELRQASQAQGRGAERDVRSGRQARRSGHALMLGEFARAVALMETVGRTEKDIADTLRAMAWADGSETASRAPGPGD